MSVRAKSSVAGITGIAKTVHFRLSQMLAGGILGIMLAMQAQLHQALTTKLPEWSPAVTETSKRNM